MSCFVGTQSDYRFPKPCYLFFGISTFAPKKLSTGGFVNTAKQTAQPTITSALNVAYFSPGLLWTTRSFLKVRNGMLRQHSFSESSCKSVSAG
ncbi:hypothetical protein CEXT_101541 [Caerostris extrusa]|uniref:Uncharacterized protein n=1 Tax=Caerostris extrusa TaxID=172846 RepID=A0AAV4V3B4_CAEEX|nr:hypothetical protein CEXT_101541 [Caerostris extrusa]